MLLGFFRVVLFVWILCWVCIGLSCFDWRVCLLICYEVVGLWCCC